MFSTTAYAQEVGSEAMGQGGASGSIIMMVALFAIFYFFVIRPQTKREQQHRDLVNNLSKGDKIITQGGVVASVTKVIDDTMIQVELADGVKVKMLRSFVFGMFDDIAAKEEKPAAKESKKDK